MKQLKVKGYDSKINENRYANMIKNMNTKNRNRKKKKLQEKINFNEKVENGR
ncbi:hypothetical protein LOAG_03563 [Loa loa]|uniref:Uncharacterized protein n=1 Tax=Loa loa TaxID=7209 RepID=A0A1S0U4X8_LOALO|nr:hypothetical protein LOAG_03563 [Loa loa]EFO24918.1 hypothetical protein LOAG_03563 [Loa loa]